MPPFSANWRGVFLWVKLYQPYLFCYKSPVVTRTFFPKRLPSPYFTPVLQGRGLGRKLEGRTPARRGGGFGAGPRNAAATLWPGCGWIFGPLGARGIPLDPAALVSSICVLGHRNQGLTTGAPRTRCRSTPETPKPNPLKSVVQLLVSCKQSFALNHLR